MNERLEENQYSLVWGWKQKRAAQELNTFSATEPMSARYGLRAASAST
ncbi:MAG: hypothetical protein ACLR8L_00205 [Oscillospiraceae bacterium]